MFKKALNMNAWEADEIQFPRLLAEIWAAGLTREQYEALRKSMDLNTEDIDELLQRAEKAWETIKEEVEG